MDILQGLVDFILFWMLFLEIFLYNSLNTFYLRIIASPLTTVWKIVCANPFHVNKLK